MSQIDNKVAALLRAGSSSFAAAEANTGQGLQGEWPPAGNHDLFVLAAHEKEGKFKDGQGREVNCVDVQFEYQWIRGGDKDPDYVPGVTPDLVFKGERFQLVPDFESALLEDGSKTRARINWDRFQGHITKMLNVPRESCTNLLDAYQKVKERIAGEVRLAVSAKIDYRNWESKDKKKSGINKTEYITANIAT